MYCKPRSKMSGMRARNPGFEYENYEDFCHRAPETIPDQIWIPHNAYLEDSVGTETKPLETDTGKKQKGMKTTVSKRKPSKLAVVASKDKKPAKMQQKPVKKSVEQKIEQKPAKRDSRKKKLDDEGNCNEEEKALKALNALKEITVNKTKTKSGTSRVRKPREKFKISEKMIEDVKKVPSATKVTKLELPTSHSL